jgi:dihydrofolate synthase/folylpolyglutamate synthase
VPVFCGIQRPEARTVFAGKAKETKSPFYELTVEIPKIEITEGEGFCGRLKLKNGDCVDLKPGMAGAFQVENAALAFLVSDTLLSKEGRETKERREAIKRAVARAALPGRMEVICDTPPVLIDAAHTPSSAARLIEAYTVMFPTGDSSEVPPGDSPEVPPGGILIFGSVIGKNPEAMAEVLCPSFKHVIISTPGTFKPSDPEAVYSSFARHHGSVELISEPERAFARAIELAGGKKPILVTGSFYMISEIRSLLLTPPEVDRHVV